MKTNWLINRWWNSLSIEELSELRLHCDSKMEFLRVLTASSEHKVQGGKDAR